MTARFIHAIKFSIYWLTIISISACSHTTPPTPITQSNIVNPTANKITLLLPLQGEYATPAQAIRDGFIAAAYAAGDHPDIIVIDSSKTSDIETAYQQAVATQPQIIVGPLAKQDVQSLATRSSLPVVTLALNNIDTGNPLPQNLYQFGLSPQDEAQQVAKQAWRDGYHQAVIITPQGSWGKGIAQAFAQHFTQQNGQIIANLAFDKQKDIHQQIKTLAQRLTTQNIATSAILLAADPNTARHIHASLKFNYANNVTIYAISLLYSGTPNPTTDRDLENITFCDMPWILDSENTLRNQIQQLWPSLANTQSRLYGLGIDAYAVANNLRQADSGFLDNFHMIGVTGNLSLNAERHIVRQLSCAKFQNGKPALLNSPMTILG